VLTAAGIHEEIGRSSRKDIQADPVAPDTRTGQTKTAEAGRTRTRQNLQNLQNLQIISDSLVAIGLAPSCVAVYVGPCVGQF
jgi:precorrin isomerase